MAEALVEAREAFRRHAWEEAYSRLTEAAVNGSLEGEDLERLAFAAHISGRAAEELLAKAHAVYLQENAVESAARCAFWLGFLLVQGGEHARGSGWLARAERVLGDLDSVVRGFLLLPQALRMLAQGEAEAARGILQKAGEIGTRYGDADLLTLHRLGEGDALIKMGRKEEGLRLLDEVMVAVTAGDVSPLVVGIVYCAVISTCHNLFDLRRAQEWTAAFARWCSSEPDMVPFRGECLIHRAEIMQVHGDWPEALHEAQRAGEWLSRPPGQRSAGSAFYRQAELHRLRGEFSEADHAYREAERWGRSPQPGQALLRLAQGSINAATSCVGRALESAGSGRNRSFLLAAAVEIFLAAGDAPAAREAFEELSAGDRDAPYLSAMISHAEGQLLFAEHRYDDALGALRHALATWRELGAPYEAARTQVQIARACRAIGDPDTCRLELDDARRAFEELHAAPDLQRISAMARHEEMSERLPGGLTPREVEVLGLVATGKTNRAIAEELFISEKTVARHLSNIFSKLGLSSRAAATAYAYEHGLATA